MGKSPNYKDLLDQLAIAARLESGVHTHTLKDLLHQLEKMCAVELENVKDKRDAAENLLQQITRERDEALRVKRLLIAVSISAVIILMVTVVIIRRPTFPPIHAPTPTIALAAVPSPRPTPTPISCSDITILGLELQSISRAGESVFVPPATTFETTETSFSLEPRTDPQTIPSNCDFRWVMLYASGPSDKFIGPKLTVYEEDVLLFEKSKCRLALSVKPIDERSGEAGNDKSFEIDMISCPHEEVTNVP